MYFCCRAKDEYAEIVFGEIGALIEVRKLDKDEFSQ